MADNHYDVIIIGTGAGGGTLAYRLAPSGKRILLLERGGYVPREKQNWDSRAVEVENRYHIKEPWYDRDGKEFHAGTHYFVGGNTKFYGAALIRLRKQDFGQVAHHGGVSPAWPIAYEDLEPYYTEAEHLYQVHGVRGAPRDERVGTRGDEGPRRGERRPGDVLGGRRRRLVRGHQLGRAPPPLRERPAPPRPRQRLRRRRPPLHVPSQLDAPRRLPRAEPDALPEDLGPERLLLPVEGVGLPDGPHLDDREDRREHAPRRGATHRAGLDAREDGRAHALLLAHLRGPAPPRQPGHRRPRRPDHPRLQTEQRGGAPASHREAQGHAQGDPLP